MRLWLGLIALTCYGQMFPFPGPGLPASGPSSTPAELDCGIPASLHCNWAVGATGGAGGVAVSPALNTTGGTLVVISAADFNNSSALDTITDVVGGTCTAMSTPANTWHHLTNQATTTVVNNNVLWYAVLTSTGVGHTFCVSGNYSGVVGAIFINTLTSSSPFDVENGVADSPSLSVTVNTGNVTPTGGANSLIVTGMGTQNSTGVATLDAPFTVLEYIAFNPGVSMGVGLGFYVTGAASTSATWHPPANDYIPATIAVFKPQ